MDSSLSYAQQFAQLVSLLSREPGNIDAQMATLRALATAAKLGPISIERSNSGIVVNGTAADPSWGGAELTARLSAHDLRGLQCKVGASADELLNLARILASAPGSTSAGSQLRALGPKNVRFLANAPSASAPERPPAPAAAKQQSPAPAPSPQRRPAPIAPTAPARARRPTPVAAADPTPPRRPTPIAPPSGFVQGGELWELFSTSAPEGSADELFAQLDGLTAPNLDRAPKLLNDLIVIVENAAREHALLAVSEVMRGIVQRELTLRDEETRRAFAVAIRRASQPLILRCVAQLLPPKPEQRDELVHVLLRAGEDGADALLERLAEAQKAEDRRVYIDVALWLRANAPGLIRDAALLQMLADDRWFVARTAADLLGEMKVTAAEEQLQALLRHNDERIRRSAATALLQLGTPSGRQAIENALADASPEVRILAASAMASLNDDEAMTSTATLLRVLDEEQDPTVELALLGALGRLATPAAVERLSQAAEAEGRFFKRKTLEFRLAAVQALGEARTDAALNALQSLESDREREVRDAVAHAQVHARRTR